MTNANATTKIPAVAAAIDGDVMTLTFANGQELVVLPTMFTPEIVAQATTHGLKQKLVDAAALSRNPYTGRSATADDKYNAVKEVFDRLLTGHWNKPREGAVAVKGGLLFAALCRMQPGRPAEEIKSWLDDLTNEQKAALRKNPKVAATIAGIRSEQVKTGDVDTDSLLDELNG